MVALSPFVILYQRVAIRAPSQSACLAVALRLLEIRRSQIDHRARVSVGAGEPSGFYRYLCVRALYAFQSRVVSGGGEPDELDPAVGARRRVLAWTSGTPPAMASQ